MATNGRKLRHCENCDVAADCLFSGLDAKHERRLQSDIRTYQVDAGQGIFYEGNPAMAVQCVVDGAVKLHKVGHRQEPFVIRLLGPGDILGYRPVLADEPYSATAIAIRPTTLCNIPRDTFLALIEESAELCRRFLRRFGIELRISEDQALALWQQSVRQRTARLLLFLLKKCPAPDGSETEIGCDLARIEMAQMIGASPETFSRTLRRLNNEGVINADRSRILIRDQETLRRIAGKKYS